MVTLTATATGGSSFVDWQGACTGANPVCQVTMDAAQVDDSHLRIVAPNTYPLTVTKSGTGSGVVTSVPAGIDCGVDCGESYDPGTVVTLTAAATGGSTFVNWQGACTGTNPVCQVTMDAAKVTTATFAFAPNTYPLTVAKSGTGSGVVASVPAGIDCGADCAESYAAGTVVTLTATATGGSTFVDWQGACTGVSAVCQITMDAAKVTTATFANPTLGSITIAKVAERGNATFQFVSQRLGDFALTTTGGTASRTFSALQPGVYAVAEIAPTGWETSTVVCTDGSNPASINLAQGESVTCTFTSHPRPTALPDGEEPTLDRHMYLPLINR